MSEQVLKWVCLSYLCKVLHIFCRKLCFSCFPGTQKGLNKIFILLQPRLTSDGNADRRTAWLRRFSEVFTFAETRGCRKYKSSNCRRFGQKIQALHFGVMPERSKNMDLEYKQRISLYLDKETVEKMDGAIKK